MSRTRLIAVSVSLALALTVSARDSRKELSVDLKFAPQEGVASNSPDLTPSVMEKAITIHVEDARGGDAAVIGQGTNDDDAAFSIRASSDVVAFVADSAKQVADGWGVKVADSADRVLTLRLMRYFVDESNKALGSVYAAEVKVAYVLSDKSGKKLMEGSTSGSAHRYGRARSAENCNEVLSDSLKETFANVLSDSRLQEAWASGRAATGTASSSTSASAPAESAEERLRKLDDLLKKGLITKEEYNKKRAEILKDI
jgi:uncharacterized lipoprotein YajG